MLLYISNLTSVTCYYVLFCFVLPYFGFFFCSHDFLFIKVLGIIYSSGTKNERHGEIETWNSPIHSLTLQMSTTAKGRIRPNPRAKNSVGSFLWVSVTQVLGPLSAVSQECQQEADWDYTQDLTPAIVIQCAKVLRCGSIHCITAPTQ